MLELVKAVSLSEVDPTQAQPTEATRKLPGTSRGDGKREMEWPSLDTLMGPESEQPSLESFPSYSSQVTVQSSRRRPPPGFGGGHEAASKIGSGHSLLGGPGMNPEVEKPSAFKRLQSVLCNDTSKLKELKVFSNYFLRNELSASLYYAQCKALCGERWLEVFDVLITSVPDDRKKSELREIHKTHLQPPTWVPNKKSGKQMSAKSRKKGSQRQASRTAWGQPGSEKGRGAFGGGLTLSEEDYPSLSTPAAVSTHSVGPSWSSRLVVRSK